MTENEADAANLFLVTESDEQRRYRVEQIRTRIARGTYDVPAAEVAAAMVAFYRRGLEPPHTGNPRSSGNSC